MAPKTERTFAALLGDQAVEATYVLARDIRSAALMRQQPLFVELDQGWLESARRGILSIVLRVAFVLHAEASGTLPLGDKDYDATLGIWPLGSRPRATHGAWKRFLRLCSILSGERRASGRPILPWGSELFRTAGLGAFAPPQGSPKGVNHHVLVPSDDAFCTLVRTLSHEGRTPIALETLPVEQVAGLYERLLGFDIIRCAGRSLRVRSSRVVVDLDRLLAVEPQARRDELAKLGLKPSASGLAKLESAKSFEELLEAVRGRGRTEPLQPGTIVLQPNLERRRAGAHYTPPEITSCVVRQTLAPLLKADISSEQVLSLRICDPSMGTAAFLTETCRQLAEQLVAAWRRESCREAQGDPQDVQQRAMYAVASRCLYGVDLDPLAVVLARTAVQLVGVGPDGTVPNVEPNLRCGDALLGIGNWDDPRRGESEPHLFTIEGILGGVAACRSARRGRIAGSQRPRPTVERVRHAADRFVQKFFESRGNQRKAAAVQQPHLLLARDVSSRRAGHEQGDADRRPFHWPLEFPEVHGAGGFDAFVGNPPWVAFAGRAAQPIEDAMRRYYLHASRAFRGYRTLQGLFVHRCASLLRPGGRLGLVVPTSMADLSGYEPVRVVHDALCEPDADLPDFGAHAFDGVFQPSMALLSTRRRCAEQRPASIWTLRRDDLDDWARDLMERLDRFPTMPREAFAERGFQSTREDAWRMRILPEPEAPNTVALREGTDVRAFQVMPPRLHLDPTGLKGLRPAEKFQQVDVLVRQTARYPIAALGDGIAFRNSVLAGFAFDDWQPGCLVAFLNAWPIRWLHYMRHRDARQGMPQVKIQHLRSLPRPGASTDELASLAMFGERVGRRNTGIDEQEQAQLDSFVARILGLSSSEEEEIQAWRRKKMDLPDPRGSLTRRERSGRLESLD